MLTACIWPLGYTIVTVAPTPRTPAYRHAGMASKCIRGAPTRYMKILFLPPLLGTNCVKDLSAIMDHNNIDTNPKSKEIVPNLESAGSLKLSETTPEASGETPSSYLTGWRLHVLTFT